eukprot:TRINITY_DN17846_c0_g1_i1.p1 TRINITY_DN17846_c0_g1~~TRINITY_DN17846_c0_g1_i1.p1  ORF type:complete len:519 (+),score=110.95 TRINITY_DN17846_c0_g1_i1:123-1559(+)
MGMCGGCVLRCCGCRDLDLMGSEEVVEKCVLCAGVLGQLKHVREAVLKFLKEESKYIDIKTVTASITLPRSHSIRSAIAMLQFSSSKGICKNVSELISRYNSDLRSIAQNEVANIARDQGYAVSNQPVDLLVKVQFSNPTADNNLAPIWDNLGFERPARYRYNNNLDHEYPSIRAVDEVFNNTRPESITALGTTFPDAPDLATFTVGMERYPLLIAGRYIKEGRNLPQTPWIQDGKRIGAGSSLHEELFRPIISNIFPRGLPGPPPATRKRNRTFQESNEINDAMGGTKFIAAGREDIDVRMFGDGRPFLFEVPNPQKLFFDEAELQNLEKIINESDGEASVVPGSLKQVEREYFSALAHSSENKKKEYRCVVWTAKPLTDVDRLKLELNEVVINQKTPLRVLHRRSSLVRPRIVHSMTVHRVLGPHFMVIDVVTQAGAYIKELINGDRGRTTPSVAQICGCPADILQLDVMNVFCDL